MRSQYPQPPDYGSLIYTVDIKKVINSATFTYTSFLQPLDVAFYKSPGVT